MVYAGKRVLCQSPASLQSAQSDENSVTVDDDDEDEASIPTPKRMHVSKGKFVYSLL